MLALSSERQQIMDYADSEFRLFNSITQKLNRIVRKENLYTTGNPPSRKTLLRAFSPHRFSCRDHIIFPIFIQNVEISECSFCYFATVPFPPPCIAAVHSQSTLLDDRTACAVVGILQQKIDTGSYLSDVSQECVSRCGLRSLACLAGQCLLIEGL